MRFKALYIMREYNHTGKRVRSIITAYSSILLFVGLFSILIKSQNGIENHYQIHFEIENHYQFGV